MLGAGDSVPEVQVWTAPRQESRSLAQVLGAGYALLCFDFWDWSQWYFLQEPTEKGRWHRSGHASRARTPVILSSGLDGELLPA